MNIYFDTEFTGLHKDTTLISIGLIAQDGSTFYAEFTDYDESQCDEWIKENVLSNLLLGSDEYNNIADITARGTKEQIAPLLKLWLSEFREDIQLVSDCCHYDMVLFIDLLGETALDLPDYISPVCYDINIDIANEVCDGNIKTAFGLSRELILESYGGEEIKGKKHNSLYDAKVIKEIYNLYTI